MPKLVYEAATATAELAQRSLKICKLEDLCQTLSIYLAAVYDCSPCFILPRDVTVSPQFATQWETSSMLASRAILNQFLAFKSQHDIFAIFKYF